VIEESEMDERWERQRRQIFEREVLVGVQTRKGLDVAPQTRRSLILRGVGERLLRSSIASRFGRFLKITSMSFGQKEARKQRKERLSMTENEGIGVERKSSDTVWSPA
jgi:hypothetical protein